MVSAKIRWQAVALGCFVGIAGSIGMGLGFSIMPAVLIVGVFLQPKFPKLGLGLICAGSLLLSFFVFDIAILTLH
jgi:hypothetical protein